MKLPARPLLALALLSALICAFAAPAALAEDVVTKTDGGRIRGKILVDAPDQIQIKTAGGVLTIPRDEIATVERSGNLAAELATKTKETEKKQSAKAWMDLSRWCEEKELWVAQADCLQRALKVDPDFEPARTELGFRKLDGRWVPEADWRTAQGYTLVDGRWLSKAEKEKLDQGLVLWGDDEWITKAEADRRTQEAAKRAEHDRQGVPTKPGESQAPAAKPAKKAKEEKARFLEGKLLYTKSREQICQKLNELANEKVTPIARTGKLEFEPLGDDLQAAALRRLRQYRYLSDVPPDTELNLDYAIKASAACKLLDMIGHLDHTPAKPPGCPDNLYKTGYDGTSHSNLYQASWNPTAVSAVDAWMFDSDQSNIDRVGHRNWCLNVTQKAVAFAAYKNFAAVYVHDQNREALPYDAVLYPARGYYPISHWQKNAAWSAHLSTRYAPIQNEKDVKVTVVPLDGNFKKGPPLEMDYFHVDGGGYGAGSSCVIFKPKATIADGARYWVKIEGLKENGQDSTLEYLVEFFQN